MDPTATPAEPLPTLAGFPFAHPGAGIVIVGPTGGGRSSLVQACLYDGAGAGLRGAYLGSEVTEPEFNARAAVLAEHRGDTVNDELRVCLARARYLSLASVVTQAWENPGGWVDGIAAAYDLIVIDPLSAVASALDLNFDQSNAEFVKFYDRLVQPLTTRGVTVVMVENVGHAIEAKSRAKGVSAKSDRADLTFSCSLISSPPGLVIRAHKVRTVRAAFQRGDEWIFDRETQTIERRLAAAGDRPETFRPTTLMERVSVLVESEPNIGKKDIRAQVQGRNTWIDKALRILVDEAYLDHEHGHGYRSLKPYSAAEMETEAARCPEGAPTSVPRVPPSAPRCPDGAPKTEDARCPGALHRAPGTGTTNGNHSPLCCCVDGGEGPGADGRCSRCYGWPAVSWDAETLVDDDSNGSA